MQSEKKKPNFSNNNILYDVLENVYSLSFQLDNVSKKEGISKYITANKDATDAVSYTHLSLYDCLIKINFFL